MRRSEALACDTCDVARSKARTEDVREANVDSLHLRFDSLLDALGDKVAASLGGRQRQLHLRPARRGDGHQTDGYARDTQTGRIRAALCAVR